MNRLSYPSQIILGALLCASSCSAVVNWNGGVQAVDVVDDNLTISNTNDISGNVQIFAQNSNITVTIGASAVLRSAGPNDALHFRANSGRSITVNVNNHLIATGNGANLFTMTYHGSGTMAFNMADGKIFRLDNSGGAGAYFFISMDTANHGAQQDSVRFNRVNKASNQDVSLIVGAESGISFISPTSVNSTASLGFNVTNDVSNTGRFIVTVHSDGAFLIQSHHNTQPNVSLTSLADIDFTTLTGRQASVRVINENNDESTTARLVITNANETWPELRNSPWCQTLSGDPQIGFILGANGLLNIQDYAYVDYIGLSLNQTLVPMLPPDVTDVWTVRNPSAFIVDGDVDGLTDARIEFGNQAALYFRSGVNNENVLEDFEGHRFAVNPSKRTPGFGNYVLVVEGVLDVQGLDKATSALEILSLAVDPFGGPVQIEDSVLLFPLRTFERDVQDNYITYNTGAFLLNERVNLFDTALKHTDENHRVLHGLNQATSDVTYMGANRIINCDTEPVVGDMLASLNFYNSDFLVHTRVALAGINLFVPNALDSANNAVDFVFFYNGRKLDDGTGRSFVLGAEVAPVISPALQSAYVTVQQDTAIAPLEEPDHELNLVVRPNNTYVTEQITGDISAQLSVHDIHLSNDSDIYLGTNGTTGTSRDGSQTFNLISFPTLGFGGSFFNISSDNILQNAIFVDTNGTLKTLNKERLFIGTMVIKGFRGIVKLPRTHVEFDDRFGITFREVDLNDPDQRVLVDGDQDEDTSLLFISDYTLDWLKVKKGYDVGFVPYELPVAPPVCNLPPVVCENITALPTFAGAAADIDQLQIRRSRIGDRVHINILDNAVVRELVFEKGYDQLEAPVATVVIDTNGELGLGSALRTPDSIDATMQLGMNGINIIANGDGEVFLNSDIIVNDQCTIFRGPDFGREPSERATLTITSEVPREIRVKTDAVLDLSQFTNSDVTHIGCNGDMYQRQDRILIGGSVVLVLEPGARLILGGGTLEFTDDAKLVIDPYTEFGVVGQGLVTDTDDFRAKIHGTGIMLFSDHAAFDIYRDAYVGIETADDCFSETNIMLRFIDSASMHVGDDSAYGGSFQVGNTINRLDDVVTLTLEIDGPNALVEIGKQGFVGVGVGVISKQVTSINGEPLFASDWLVGSLFNTNRINVNVRQGTFKHSIIENTDGINASVLAIGDLVDVNRGRAVQSGRYVVSPRVVVKPAGSQFLGITDLSEFKSLGGGNVLALNNPPQGKASAKVQNKAGQVAPGVTANIMPSTPLYTNASKAATNNQIVFDGANVATMARFLATPSLRAPGQRVANIAREAGRRRRRRRSVVGAVDEDVIMRDVVDLVSNSAEHSPSLAVGAVALGVKNKPLEL